MYGPIIILLANLFFTGSFSLAKWLSLGTSVWVIMLFRFLAGPVYLGPYCAIKKTSIKIHDWPLLWFRAICGVGAMSSLFFAYKYGDIAKSTLLFETSILWTVIFEALVLKKPLHRYSILALPLAFIGLVLVLDVTSFGGLQKSDAFALIGSIFNAGVFLSLKKLRVNHHALPLVFWTYSLSVFLVIVPAAPQLFYVNTNHIMILIIMCSVGVIGQSLMTLGFKFSSASVSSLFMMSIVPFTAISGALFFNERLTLINIIGMTIVIISLSIVARYR